MDKVQKELRLGKKYKQIRIKHKYTLISMDMNWGWFHSQKYDSWIISCQKNPEQRCDFASLKQNALIKQQQRQLLLVQTSDDCYSVNNRLRISNLNNLPNSSCIKANSS